MDQTTVRQMEGGTPIFRNVETHCATSLISTSIFIAYYDIVSDYMFSLMKVTEWDISPFIQECGALNPLAPPCDFHLWSGKRQCTLVYH